jgi:hypothetical protein
VIGVLERVVPNFRARMLLRQRAQRLPLPTAPASSPGSEATLAKGEEAAALPDATETAPVSTELAKMPKAANADVESTTASAYERPDPWDRSKPAYSRRRTRPLADDFVRSIIHEEGFALQDSIFEVLPGDVIAWEFAFEDDKMDITGHVMFIEAVCTFLLLLL